MKSKLLKFSLISILFLSVIPTQSADSTYLGKFCKAFYKISTFTHPQRKLDLKFLIAVLTDNLDSVKYWLNCGANINAIQDYTHEEIFNYLHYYEIPKIRDMDNMYESKRYSALMIAKSFKMIKYLIENGANVNYESHVLYYTYPELEPFYKTKSTLQTIIIKSLMDGNPRMSIAALEAGAVPSEEDLNDLRKKSKTNPTAKTILNFIHGQCIKEMDKTLQCMPKALTGLISEYM